MDGRWRLATLVATIGCLAGPAAADAATRYAGPGGNGPEPCALADPCEIHDAAQGHVPSDVVNGDEIILLPGEYSITQSVNLLDPNLNFHGQSGQPRPRIVSTASAGVFTNQAGVEISHLEIEQSGSLSGLVTTAGSVTIEEVRVHTFSPTNFSFTCQLSGTVTMKNSVCWSSGLAGAAVGINMSGGGAAVTLRNVTAVSSASFNSFGIFYGGSGAGANFSVAATNVIADGVTQDVAASASSGATVAITLDHSNYNTEFETGGGTVTNPGTGTNQTAAPVYLDAANGGFHQASGSPTINQGVNDAANGSFDIDLEPRTVDTTTDIGADEFVSLDTDGDGRPDGADDCPSGNTGWTSNASTDHDSDGCRDAGEDTDDDNDGKADGADSCPTGSIGWTSTTITDVDSDGCRDNGEDADDDNDTVADGTDNCPVDANTNQANNDGDAQGDVCDPDDDDDAVADGADNCQFAANADQANNDGDAQGDVCDADDDNDTVDDGTDNCQFVANTSQTNTDGDSEGDACDTDDDNDTVLDGADSCPTGASAGTDTDGDGCKDVGEDTDDDNDTVLDGADDCPTGASAGTDTDGDGCKDVGEDTDDDNDTVLDGSDNCPTTSNPGQANSDSDGAGDACDPDDDDDGVADASDACPAEAGPGSNNGCPVVNPPPTDADPPETTIDKAPKKKSMKRKAKLIFSADEPGSSFECKLDRGAFTPCASPFKKKVKAGKKHTFQVRAIDAAGNVDRTPDKAKWKVLKL